MKDIPKADMTTSNIRMKKLRDEPKLSSDEQQAKKELKKKS